MGRGEGDEENRLTEAQIMGLLRQAEGGLTRARVVPGARDQQRNLPHNLRTK